MKLIKFSRWLLTATGFTLALGLASCASTKHVQYSYFSTDQAPVNSVDKNAQAELANTAQAVNQSLQQLSAIKMATHPNVPMPAPIDAKAVGMDQIVSINWNGPIQPVLKKIADTAGYKLNVLGSAPQIPLIINLNAQNETLATILRNITYQASNTGAITIYPASKVLELRYYDQS